MLYRALVFLLVAIVAGALGFGGIAGASAGIAQVLSGNALITDFWSNFDDPEDQEQIMRGRQFAACMLGH